MATTGGRPSDYDVDLAERRYEAVDPDNRLIAATLEQRWNEAMQRLHDLEAELAAFERQAMRAVTAEQKRQILQLAGDFPRLWAASTTTPRDRKRILRLLVRDITVMKEDRSGRPAPPSPYDTAFSEGSGSCSVLPGSSPITFASPSSKARQKSGSFALPALPSLHAPTTLSESRLGRRLSQR